MTIIKHTNKILSGFHNKRLVILGGLGFLGRWVTNTALQFGADVIIVDRSNKPSLNADVEVINEDILITQKLEALFKKADFVVHLAGNLGTESTFSNLPKTIEDNVVVTAKVIEACLKVGRRAVFPTVGNDWLNPYTISRKCAADFGIMANLECGGDFRVLKIMNAYGPWQAYNSTRKIIPTFIRQFLLNEPAEIYGDGNQCIDLIHAQDVSVALLLGCLSEKLPIDRYIEVGTSIPYRVIEVAEIIRKLAGSSSRLKFVGKRKGEPMHSVTLAKDDILKRITCFEPEIPLEKGLAETFNWYTKNPSYLEIAN